MIDAVRIASELVRVPSENRLDDTSPQAGEKKLTEYLCAFFRDHGISFTRQEAAHGRENILAYVHSPVARFTVLLDAHQDTVPAGKMTVPPFGGEVSGGRLWGRGSCDVKGGMAAMIAAVCRIAAEKPKVYASVVLACTVDEEHTFQGVQRLLAGPWPGRKPGMAIVAEPSRLDVVIAHKGLTRWKISTRGKSCHAASPELGENAIYRMGEVLAVLERYSAELSERRPHPLLGLPTLSVGVISGGTGVNVVPASCAIEIDRRLVPGEDPGTAFDDCRDAVLSGLRDGFPVDLEKPWLAEPALDTPVDAAVSRIALKAVSDVLGTSRAIGVPYGTDASTISAGGIPAVVLGPGDIAQAHTEDEWIDVARIEEAAEIYYRIVCGAGSLP
jgi:acetylornithine deacetylase